MLARVNLTRTARALAAAPLGTAAIAATSSSSLAAATASHTPAPRKRARLATPLQAARAFATTRAVHNGDALANANIFASSPDERVSVTSLTPSAGFTLSDGLVVPSPVLLIDGACFLWDVSHPTEGKGKNPMGFDWDGWTREKMQIFEALSPRPEILLVGTGTSTMFAPPAFKKYLNGLGIQVDVLDSRNAASTYNLLQEEGRRVAAALYPVSHLSARTGLVA
ncbi:hypothetical protein Rhopal_000751-T1 [Rhodotorula paludigena]|uniref:NADH dehydrogenase [ubiquinone] 1 alpha subcomplex assembly factor 3 n=1 Tax=Rhodotorula paludigena TaxID=86838 RepID=A0AAV5G5J6_9BASI|nr:hypothetical protein Rhopal_000751-T1 [Rhodotorula paludigena]